MPENSGRAIAITVAVIAFVTLLPVLLIVFVYVFLSIYAIVKAFGAGGRSPNPATILIGVALIAGTLTTMLTVGLALLGRGMEAPKRRDNEAGELPGVSSRPR